MKFKKRDIAVRPRRLRRMDALRRLVRETCLNKDDFIAPVFISVGENKKHSISSMPPYADVAEFSVEKSKESSQILVNINTALEGELVKLSSIGPVTAERVMRYRTDFGRFNTIEELKNVKRIGSQTLEYVKTQIILN